MKSLIQRYRRSTILLLGAGLICCATYLLAQITSTPEASAILSSSVGNTVSPPSEQEAADSARLIEALNANDYGSALQILQAYGIANSTISTMAARLGKTTQAVALNEPFVKASQGLPLPHKANDFKASVQTAQAQGYGRVIWEVGKLETNWVARYDAESALFTVSPVAEFDTKLNDPTFIRYFQWYDRYADQLHSVILNSEKLVNIGVSLTNYPDANRQLNALAQLIKARRPSTFVWLSVAKKEGHSDELWLKAMSFHPDGAQILNLRQFHSPFAETHDRYTNTLRQDLPMLVADFCGEEGALREKGHGLYLANVVPDPGARETARLTAKAHLGAIGAVVASDMPQFEASLRELGFRGVSVHPLLLEAMAGQDNARASKAPVPASDLVDTRAGWLEAYYKANDFQSLSDLATSMVTDSAPGDMNWTIGKLYQGISSLGQTPPDIQKGIAPLDEVLAFDFKGKSGRDHYILGVVKWRIYAASLTGDKAKMEELAQWAQSQPFRKDLKAQFAKQFKALLRPAATNSN